MQNLKLNASGVGSVLVELLKVIPVEWRGPTAMTAVIVVGVLLGRAVWVATGRDEARRADARKVLAEFWRFLIDLFRGRRR